MSHTVKSLPGEIRWSPARSIWLTTMVGLTLAFGPETLSWSTFSWFAVTTAVTLCLGHSVGLHRGLIHRTYRTHLWLERALVYLGVLCGMGGPIGLFRMHETRDHWQNQGRAPEFYTYEHGWLRDHWWYCHAEYRPDAACWEAPVEVPERVTGDRWYRWLERRWMAQQLPVALLMWVWGGWPLVVWGVFARIAVGGVGHWLVNYVAHTSGDQRYHIHGSGEQGRNTWLFGALTFGEGWHNNHHAWPNSARMGLTWWEVDLGFAVIRALQAMGLVWDVQVAPELEPRRPMDRLH